MLLLLGSIAEQQYRFHLLLKLLIEKGVISSGDLDSKFNEKEKSLFSQDLLEQLVATGLRIAGSSPSSLPKEPPSAEAREATGGADPESESRS